jgi:hypothetical protein
MRGTSIHRRDCSRDRHEGNAYDSYTTRYTAAHSLTLRYATLRSARSLLLLRSLTSLHSRYATLRSCMATCTLLTATTATFQK